MNCVLEQETDMDFTDQLFEAILDNNIEIVKSKIDSGLTGLTKSPTSSDMALHFACLNSKLEIINLLSKTLKDGEINTINIESDDTICGTALHMSMDGQVDVKVVQLLLSLGANPNAIDAKGSPILHELIYRAWEDFDNKFRSERGLLDTDEYETLEELEDIDSTRCSESRDNFIETEDPKQDSHPSQDAHEISTENSSIGNSYFEKLELLHQFGADINLINSVTTMTPLHFWSQNFHFSMKSYIEKSIPKWCYNFLQLLLHLGANPNILNDRGNTAMDYMAQRHYKPCHTVFATSYREITSLLIPNFSNATAVNIYDRNLLHSAVEMSNYIFIVDLLEAESGDRENAKSFVNFADKFGLTPLHIITHNITKDEIKFVIDIINELVKYGGNVNSQDKHGSTPLHHAIHLDNHTATRQLIKHKACTAIKDNSGRSACDLAKIEGDAIIQEIIGLSDRLPAQMNACPTSNMEHGVYYPSCCVESEATSSTDASNTKTEEPETVKDTQIDEWLQKHQVCSHNRNVILQNAISVLEKNSAQKTLCNSDSITMRREIYALSNKAANSIAKLNPFFDCNVIFGGSVSEGTKIGSCDEFDMVFALSKLHQYVEVIEETPPRQGLVKLKVLNRNIFAEHNCNDLIDDYGYLKRQETSNRFHKYLEQALASREIWVDNSYFSFRGSTNSAGECFNIGQMNLVWFGPFQKRQTVSVDIVLALKLDNWQSKYWNTNIQITTKETAKLTGCYLVLKDLTSYLDQSDDENEDMTTEPEIDQEVTNTLFKISISQIEHAVMQGLPMTIKNGYKLAKTIFLQCPKVSFKWVDVFSSIRNDSEVFQQSDGKINAVAHVKQFITSYVLKTGLFHELHNRGIRIPIVYEDILPDKWNNAVLTNDVSDVKPTRSEIAKSLTWALNIYKAILKLIVENDYIPEYFMPDMEATKVRGKTESFVKIISAFLKILIHLLENFQIPKDLYQ